MDAFEDIKEVKSQLLMQGDPTVYNKISIEEYMPKEPVKEALLRKKTGRIRTSNNDEALDDQLQQLSQAEQMIKEDEEKKKIELSEEQMEKMKDMEHTAQLMSQIQDLIKKDKHERKQSDPVQGHLSDGAMQAARRTSINMMAVQTSGDNPKTGQINENDKYHSDQMNVAPVSKQVERLETKDNGVNTKQQH